MDNAGSGVRKRRRVEKTRALLDHAADLVVERGLEGLTMPALARRAGVAVGGLYRYFDDKEHLIAELQIGAVRQLAEHLDGTTDIPSVARGVVAFGATHPTPLLLLQVAVSDPRQLLRDDLALRVAGEVEPILAHVDGLFADAVQRGELTDAPARPRTLALWALVLGVLALRKQDRLEPAPERGSSAVLEEGLRALMRGWSAR